MYVIANHSLFTPETVQTTWMRDDAPSPTRRADLTVLTQLVEFLKLYQCSLALLRQLEDLKRGSVTTNMPSRNHREHAIPITEIRRSMDYLCTTPLSSVSPEFHLEQMIFVVHLLQESRDILKQVRWGMTLQESKREAREGAGYMDTQWITSLFHAHCSSPSTSTHIQQEILQFVKYLNTFVPLMPQNIDLEDAIQWGVGQHLDLQMQERRIRKGHVRLLLPTTVMTTVE